MLVTASANRELDDILDLIGASTQLTQTQREQAETSYLAVGNWLDADDSPIHRYRPVIFAQGSLALDTTNKPLFTDFDLDLVCLMQRVDETYSPASVYDFLLKRIQAHGTYKKIMEPMPRCIRLNYSGDFHLDIVPAVTDSMCPPGQTCIFIPDRPLLLWRSSNPLGYVQWFDEQARKRMLVENYSAFSMRKKANVTPLRDSDPISVKPPLKIAVQLLKRWRDVEFQDRMEVAPSSIILTTLAGHLYQGEPHPTDAIMNIVDGICAWAEREPIRMQNPSNPKEWITDRWAQKPKMYGAFIEAIFDLRSTWRVLVQCNDYDQMVKLLKQLFENWPVTKALKSLGEKRAAARQRGLLYMTKSNGNLGIAASPGIVQGAMKVKQHAFHGEE